MKCKLYTKRFPWAGKKNHTQSFTREYWHNTVKGLFSLLLFFNKNYQKIYSGQQNNFPAKKGQQTFTNFLELQEFKIFMPKMW